MKNEITFSTEMEITNTKDNGNGNGEGEGEGEGEGNDIGGQWWLQLEVGLETAMVDGKWNVDIVW